MQIQLGKKYQTRNGDKVEIYTVTSKGKQPVVGVCFHGNREGYPTSWNADGTFYYLGTGGDKGNDLVEVSAKISVDPVFINIYEDKTGKHYVGAGVHKSCARANNTNKKRVACVKVILTGTIGDGLTAKEKVQL